MSDYVFRKAELCDKPQIVKFLDDNWGSEHPLIHNEKFFEYYYCGNDGLQFALCFKNNVLISLCGYILANQKPEPDIWLSIWLALKGENGAGLELMAELPKLCGARVMACNNIRPKTMPFYTFLGYTAARLPHFYRLADKAVYSVCRVNDKLIVPVKTGNSLLKIKSKEELAKRFAPSPLRLPYKDLWYYNRRYFEYPYQSYDVWRLDSDDKTDAILVTRTIEVGKANVLRIVDYTGMPERFKDFGFGINELMLSLDAEYADMYCYGIDADTMLSAGFCERDADSVNIIPNYLSPPLYENTEYYFFTSKTEGFTMFKADGDQDRPNIIL